MTRLICMTAVFALLVPLIGITIGDEKTPTIAEIMARAHKKNKLRDQIKAGIDKPSPEWDSLQKMSKEFYTLASALEKNDPPLGEKDSWKKLSKEYAEAVKVVDAAVAAKDQKASQAAFNKLGNKCAECHKVHRE